MKKKIFILILLFCIISVKGRAINKAEDSLNINEAITYDTEFRAVWITTLTGDISPYSSEAAFKGEMNTVFAVMEHFKLNAMIFHIRTHNNALYKSELNPVAGWWKTVNFDKFDPLAWLIDECHKRGYEFHAWMNPYRLGNSHYYGSELPSVNPDNRSENRLSSILNPGLSNVREFLIDTVMEVIENYDVDAINFDDYFYRNLGTNGALTGPSTILDEPDQGTYLANLGDYNPNSAYDKANWRRDQINLFIEGLSLEIKKYNSLNNKHIQLGISPTGIYKNGDGVVTYDSLGNPITTGSKTGGQEHYSSYLFSDSMKWIVEGWLDYILPQSYWATNHPVGSYYEVMGWWDKVVENLDVNLYSGIGVYQANENDRYAWMDDSTELSKQLNYVNSLDNVAGVSFYAYKHLLSAYRSSTSMSSKQLEVIGNTVWLENKLLPEINSMESIHLGEVNNFISKGNTLTWDALEDAKFYIIFRDGDEIDFSDEQIIAVIGSNDSMVTYVDTSKGNYVYGLKVMSYTNSVGEGSLPTILPPDIVYDLSFYVDDNLIASYKTDEVFDLPLIPIKYGYDRVAPFWSLTDFSNISEDTRVDAVYTINQYRVDFFDKHDNLAGTKFVNHGADTTGIELPEEEGFIFKGWDTDLSNIEDDLEVRTLYEIMKYEVKFYGFNDELIKEEIVPYGQNATAPIDIDVSGYEFVGWDKDFGNIFEDLEIRAIYKEIEKEKPSIFSSCVQINYNFIVFTLAFALFMFMRRKR